LVYQRFQRDASIVPTWVNHQPAFLYYLKGRLFICQVFSISPDGDRVSQINNVIDPDKLKAIAGHHFTFH
jgi:RNA polymerase sigma-70 factor (ECF subfamily)